ncbi:hypothetical protein D3C84_1167850 [compost metagenome]
MNNEKLSIATKALLEALHIISHDGFYSDTEALIETLTALGVDVSAIDYHQK